MADSAEPAISDGVPACTAASESSLPLSSLFMASVCSRRAPDTRTAWLMVLLARSTASAHSGDAVGEAATLLAVVPENRARSRTASRLPPMATPPARETAIRTRVSSSQGQAVLRRSSTRRAWPLCWRRRTSRSET